MIGLAIDTGLVMTGRRQIIAVSDGAALAAAGALSGDPTITDAVRQQRATERANQYAQLNKFDPTKTGYDLTIDFPTGTPASKKVQVEASKPVDLAFMKIFGMNQVTVTSGARVAEAAPLDVVIVQDVSISQLTMSHCMNPLSARGNILIDPNFTGDRETCDSIAAVYKSATGGYDYRATEATTTFDWPPRTNAATGYRTNVPWRPFARQQWAARYFVGKLDPRYDQVSLVSFSTAEGPNGSAPAKIQQGLTKNYNLVLDAIGYSPETPGEKGKAGLYPAGGTALAAGIRKGIEVLTADTNARANAVGAMILLTDGSATNNLDGTRPGSCNSSNLGPCSPCRQDAMNEAQAAAERGIVIYTIFVGSTAYEQDNALLMQWIADLTDNRKLEGNYTGTRNLPTGYGPVLNPPPTENYFRAYEQSELQNAYDLILQKVYTRLIR
jgi:hypothetical protein